jgi:hypothetical protein
MWETQIGSKQGLNILHSNTAVGASIWEQHCGLENGIKQKAAKNTADNKSSKKRSSLSGSNLKMIGKRERVRHSKVTRGRNNVEFT